VKKLLALAAVCGTVLVVAVSPASTAKIDNIHGGPVCADITNNSGIFDYTTGTLTFVIGTVAPSCKGLTYTVSAYDQNSGAFLGSGSAMGNKMLAPGATDGSGFVIVSVPIDESQVTSRDSFCIVATSSDDRVFDRAPDTGCISFPTTSSGGQTGFN
jgi:hypothetical protein